MVSKVSLAGIGNRTPRIVGQNPVTTLEDTPVTIILDNLIVDAPLLNFPEEVTLASQPRPADANYTRDGNAIIPNENFNGVLFVPVTVRDGNIASNIWNLRIDVTKVNDPPTDIRLSNNTILENQVLDTVIGRFTTTDPDIGDLHIYTLVPTHAYGRRRPHRQRVLRYRGGPACQPRGVRHETRNRTTILVRSRDPEGLSVERAFQIRSSTSRTTRTTRSRPRCCWTTDTTDANGDGLITFGETLRLRPALRGAL